MVLTTQLDRGTPFRSRVKFQAGYTQLARSTGANVSVMVLQGTVNPPPRKADQLSLAMGDNITYTLN